MNKLMIGIAIFFILAGCNSNKEISNSNDQQLIRVKNSEIEEVDRKTGVQISRHLVELATSIPNVNDATAVVVGKYAIVGIDVNAKIERSQIGSIKYAVAESLKNDPYGARSVVIADPDVSARLEEISEDIQNGKPIQGIMNELADISGRLMPEIPADIIEPKPKNGLKNSKDGLNQNEKDELENKQDEQSNHYKNN